MNTQASIEREAATAGVDGDLRERVLNALAQVYDPELDEPITELRFIGSCAISRDGDVEVILRLPTPQCAPNFAFLMGADSRRVVGEVEGVRDVVIRFEDHYTGEEINAALNRGAGFTGAFPGETDDDDLEALRELFIRKALVARQSRICEWLRAQGVDDSELIEMTVAQLPDTPQTARVLQLRGLLGIAADGDAPAFVHPSGEPVAGDQLRRWLRAAQLVRVSLEANGEICRGLLQARHTRHKLAAQSGEETT
ncbi:MAG TPA: iron-sulfur cluster assembly protein [Solirubrobacteraceae bacterium]|nr:iron-sulfur cluster assembly protein [Solirubrobacteraceae bacterium]